MSETHRQRIIVARAQLAVVHPKLFDLEKPVPFSIGFHDELKSLYPEMPKVILKGLLWWLTRRRAYLLACESGAIRYGLFGPLGHVSESEAAYARKLHAEQSRQKQAPKKAPKKARKNLGPY